MRTSSAPESETSGVLTDAVGEPQQTGFTEFSGSRPSIGLAATTSTPLSAPSVNAYGSAYAAASRLLGRMNTRTVERAEMQRLLNERQALLDKRFDGTITKPEENRLTYVRWTLGRIQDARSGESLDALESIVGAYEMFLTEMRRFEGELREAVKTHRENDRKRNRRVNKGWRS